jgi:hypothetical protein
MRKRRHSDCRHPSRIHRLFFIAVYQDEQAKLANYVSPAGPPQTGNETSRVPIALTGSLSLSLSPLSLSLSLSYLCISLIILSVLLSLYMYICIYCMIILIILKKNYFVDNFLNRYVLF